MKPTLPTGATIKQHVKFGQVLTLESSESRTEIALHGATVLSFTANPSDRESRSLLWLSNDATAANGKPIRGGIPLCAPWFGPHPNASSAPAHGLARQNLWDLSCVEELAGGSLRVTLTIDFPKNTANGWNHDAKASFILTVGRTLAMELTVRNTGVDPFLLSEAMHTYFAVSNVRNVRVEGLENTEYLDFAGDGKRHMHGGTPVTLTDETTHMFYTGQPVRLVDEEWKRAIDICGYGAATTVVWNPWKTTASKANDIQDQWPDFLCVENANIPDVAVLLPPNTSHHMGTVISVGKV